VKKLKKTKKNTPKNYTFLTRLRFWTRFGVKFLPYICVALSEHFSTPFGIENSLAEAVFLTNFKIFFVIMDANGKSIGRPQKHAFSG